MNFGCYICKINIFLIITNYNYSTKRGSFCFAWRNLLWDRMM